MDLLGDGVCWLSQAPSKVVQVVKQHVDLFLQRSHVRRHILVLLRIFEAITAIRRIDALEVQVSAALAWRLAVALDFAALALVAASQCQYALFSGCACDEEDAYHASEMYRERRDLLLGPCEPSSPFLLLP